MKDCKEHKVHIVARHYYDYRTSSTASTRSTDGDYHYSIDAHINQSCLTVILKPSVEVWFYDENYSDAGVEFPSLYEMTEEELFQQSTVCDYDIELFSKVQRLVLDEVQHLMNNPGIHDYVLES